MKKTYYAELLPGYNDLCKQIVCLAIANNGGYNEKTVEDLANIVNAERCLYPALYENFKAEIIGDNTLHIEKRNYDDTYDTVCVIEAREIFTMPEILTEYNGYGALAE